MATSNDLLIKQRSVIEFLAAEGCSAANIHTRMKTVYGEMCISHCAVRKRVRIFKGEDPRETRRRSSLRQEFLEQHFFQADRLSRPHCGRDRNSC
ncbi:hypothetical protein PoB_001108800 [Plakobranchus ocellatus]|uniref:Mos1 transposase HTH domain-containing protein n=1 Tax=Plakobranchus ocellatus TaxID=259542 RepID=A0AAV3YQH9_9GAST|nr:hypothetical protein PoB_001108800 [Plakobranchus ocellatus]